eukprot:10221578-Alexandrium_andersonii.AAC.1
MSGLRGQLGSLPLGRPCDPWPVGVWALCGSSRSRTPFSVLRKSAWAKRSSPRSRIRRAVSYTHLTLPTICSV